jgi:hypothetical protein
MCTHIKFFISETVYICENIVSTKSTTSLKYCNKRWRKFIANSEVILPTNVMFRFSKLKHPNTGCKENKKKILSCVDNVKTLSPKCCLSFCSVGTKRTRGCCNANLNINASFIVYVMMLCLHSVPSIFLFLDRR